MDVLGYPTNLEDSSPFPIDEFIARTTQWLQKNIGENGDLGKIFSVAHAAFQFADFIGCSPKILVGQDFALDRNRLHSKSSYYSQKMEDSINQYATLNLLNQQNFHKYSNNIIDRQGI